MFIQYGYQLCLTFELKNFQTKKAASVRGLLNSWYNKLCDLFNNNYRVRFYMLKNDFSIVL